MVNLTSFYTPIADDGGVYKFLGRNASRKASLYWGETLLSMYAMQFAENMGQENPPFYKGYAVFDSKSPPTDDIESLDFWRVECYLISFAAVHK